MSRAASARSTRTRAGEDGDKPNPVMGEFFGDKHP